MKFNEIESKYFIYLKGIKLGELKLNNKSFTIKDIIHNNIYLDNQKRESLLDFIKIMKKTTLLFLINQNLIHG